ncbi:hypothetical protein V8C42DRAFT_150026 [Trichoderma barbatum]
MTFNSTSLSCTFFTSACLCKYFRLALECIGNCWLLLLFHLLVWRARTLLPISMRLGKGLRKDTEVASRGALEYCLFRIHER